MLLHGFKDFCTWYQQLFIVRFPTVLAHVETGG